MRPLVQLGLIALLCGSLSTPLVSQTTTVVYREAADLFEVLDNVSEWWPDYTEPEYRQYWTDSIGFQPGDSALFASYAALRSRYVVRPSSPAVADWRTGSGLFSHPDALIAQGHRCYHVTH
jgi:hypothetical protein